MSKSFSGKSVLITGAGGGIGRHLVDGFLENGARVIGADLATESLNALSKEYATKALETIELDISDSHACDAVAKEFGHIDILINNAAASMGLIRDDHLNRLVSLDEITPDIWDHFVTTNLSGAWYMTRAVVPSMRQKGWGRIINVTTSFFTMLRPMFHPYGPTKAALEAMSAGQAGEFAAYGITVNVVVPGGPTDTPMVPEVTDMDRKTLIPPGAMVPPMLWLCSKEADQVTGMRYVAANWNSNSTITENRAASEAPIAWPNLAVSPVWPGGRPKI